MKPVVKVLLILGGTVALCVSAFVAFVVVIVLSTKDGTGTTERRASTASESRTPSSTAASRAEPARPKFVSFGNGMQIVGKDIQPGTYRTRKRAPGCYWARLSGFSGELGDLLSNGNESGPAIVTIGSSDKGFESRGCGTWSADLSGITSGLDAPFSDGTFIVGVDISPGTWRADAPESCYWARLRGFSGAMGDLIANDNGNAVVTIAPSDKGFANQRCGTWTRLN